MFIKRSPEIKDEERIFMKRILIILVLVTYILSAVITISYANTSVSSKDIDQAVIEQLIKKYLVLKYESLKDQNFHDFAKLFSFKETSVGELTNECYQYERDRLNYFIESMKITNDKLLEYNISIKFNKIDIVNSNKAEVEAIVRVDCLYNYTNGVTNTIQNVYKFTLIKNNKTWLIEKDIYDDEFKQLYGYKTDFWKKIKNMKTDLLEFNKKQSELSIKLKESNLQLFKEIEEDYKQNISKDFTISPHSIPGDTYISYNRGKAAEYAVTYTDNTGTNSTANYNKFFKSFADNDCQNFVSQCIWYGFGGVNEPLSINSHDIPMMIDWWCDSSGASNYSGKWNWTYVPDFYDYVTQNYSANGYGVRGLVYDIKYIQPGDVVYTPSHVLIVSSINDINGNGYTDWNEIYVSAHTKNRLNVNITQLYGSVPPSNLKFIKIINFKYNAN
ncbi:Putative amidase domain-containing protein [Thermoanaerobacter uzonensis DSM 18761]|jgi:hypothetical protein|uniref:Putative amidase domain-containing protein n=1 Tax=Thermoanaerobacter uzonensis DSM 18761 TaxID=1123369 RepID=A0A1M4TFW1_9THEO|nr:amidase domain-containing protein [Thermoanaerobacter uzonensis]SHE43321.1 Putative amidase domain-containing protein [Thermoanaerobacter uzonensis DSM 18761]